MPDIGLSVQVSQTYLGLPPLELNDHVTYYVAPQFLGTGVVFNRNQVTSPYADGAVTVSRTKGMVDEQVAIEILGPDEITLAASAAALIAAMTQDNFTMTVIKDGSTKQYQCEAADYQPVWTAPRLVAFQLQILFAIPRQPNPLIGAY